MVSEDPDQSSLTTSALAASTYRRGVRCLLMGEDGRAAAAVSAAIALDPTFALAHSALALLATSHGLPVDVTARRQDAALHARRSTPRERSHVEAVLGWLDGDRRPARRHLASYPRDALVQAMTSDRWTTLVGARGVSLA